MKTRLSIELVARDSIYLDAELYKLSRRYHDFSMVNIPDLLRFPVRSWQGCVQAKHYVNSAIPHLRAIDFDLRQPQELIRYLEDHQLSEVLVVKGDPPEGAESRCFETTSVDLIRFIKARSSSTKVYAAIDPYRSDLAKEVAYAAKKLEAGAEGFFTQPFFSIELMQSYRDALRRLTADAEIFWGVSPVVGAASQNYWQRVNGVDFPEGFEADLAWNKRFACDALNWVRQRDESIYFMPIRIDIEAYFEGVLF